jgi:hypothetical protein
MLKRTIRRCLAGRTIGPIETVLRDEVSLTLRRPIGDTEWNQALREMAGELEFGTDPDLGDRTIKLK